MSHNVQLIQSRIAKYEAMEVSAVSPQSVEQSVRSLQQRSSSSNDSDMIDTSSSGSNESFYSTRRSLSVNQLALEAKDTRRDTVRLSFSKLNRPVLSRKQMASPSRQSLEPDRILSDEEKIFGSGENRHRRDRQSINKSRRQSRMIHSSDSNSSGSAMD